MESQCGHHPGHHGHSAPHSSTLPHQIHVGGGNIPHQINLDIHPHQHYQKHTKTEHGESHKTHQSSSHTTHHHHHHVSSWLILLLCNRYL